MPGSRSRCTGPFDVAGFRGLVGQIHALVGNLRAQELRRFAGRPGFPITRQAHRRHQDSLGRVTDGGKEDVEQPGALDHRHVSHPVAGRTAAEDTGCWFESGHRIAGAQQQPQAGHAVEHTIVGEDAKIAGSGDRGLDAEAERRRSTPPPACIGRIRSAGPTRGRPAQRPAIACLRSTSHGTTSPSCVAPRRRESPATRRGCRSSQVPLRIGLRPKHRRGADRQDPWFVDGPRTRD